LGLPLISDEDGARWITLNRPEILNALRLEDLAAIVDAVTSIDQGIRAIVLTGAGDRAFSAGMHVHTFTAASREDGRAIITQVRDAVGAIRLAPVPTIAMLNGYCLGAAFEMALAADLRVAHPGVKVGLPEVKLGIPSVVDAALLYHYVGLSKAREMILTGDLYSVTDLAPFGFANRLVEPSDLKPAVLALLRGFRSCTREVLAAQKTLFETWLNSGLQASIAASVDIFADLFALPVTAEAIARYQPARRR
jgi:enoyl-CoA hydratase